MAQSNNISADAKSDDAFTKQTTSDQTADAAPVEAPVDGVAPAPAAAPAAVPVVARSASSESPTQQPETEPEDEKEPVSLEDAARTLVELVRTHRTVGDGDVDSAIADVEAALPEQE